MIRGSCLCGAVGWQFEGQPDGATACSCTACRRYGVLWAYDYEDEGIKVSGQTHTSMGWTHSTTCRETVAALPTIGSRLQIARFTTPFRHAASNDPEPAAVDPTSVRTS
jgi:hypothetical protein